MHRVKSTLPDSGFPIIIIAWANILLLLCVCILLNNHLIPQFGFDISQSESHFNISRVDRTQTHVISIAAGDQPRLFLDMQELPHSWDEIREELKKLSDDKPALTHIVIMQDEAVSIGTTQRLVDQILSLGYRCSLSACPAVD